MLSSIVLHQLASCIRAIEISNGKIVKRFPNMPFFFNHIYLFVMCMHMWESEDYFCEVLRSFHRVGPEA